MLLLLIISLQEGRRMFHIIRHDVVELLLLEVDQIDHLACPVTQCSVGSDLAAEMATALAATSIVFKDDTAYSKKLVKGAITLFKFSKDKRGRYSQG